ncbi:MAG TPA: VOC family protein [Acidimicrobiales bacterium]|nr:VOC family protein [Acidimicrobiales bacterium]
MTALEGYHVGILVADIAPAAERFSAILGVTFNPPTTLHGECLVEGEGGPRPFELTVTYSREGPMHYELIQANEHDIYSISLGEGLHHIGVWCPDPRRELDRLAPLEVHPHVRLLRNDGETAVWYSHAHQSHGVRLEFVDEHDRPGVEGLMAGLGLPEYE